MQVSSTRQILDRREIEWVIGALITAVAVYLHWVNFRSAGALWRDEAGIVRIATLPAVREMWSNIGHESCPILFPALIRAWSFTFGGTDAALRVFGFIVGLLMLGAVWSNGWLFDRSAPLIGLGLLAVNPGVVRWGDSLRAYGLASMLMLVTLAIVWRFARWPNLKHWLAGGDQRPVSVSKFFLTAGGLCRRRCGESAVPRFEKRACRAGDRCTGGDVAATLSRDHS